jgi:hypothetical protein
VGSPECRVPSTKYLVPSKIPAAKAAVCPGLYAALKRRSSTVVQAKPGSLASLGMTNNP